MDKDSYAIICDGSDKDDKLAEEKVLAAARRETACNGRMMAE